MDFWTIALPLMIFLAEVFVVTLGTLRIIFVARGHKIVTPILGFFEILSWLFAAGVTMKNLDQWQCSVAFALGFTLGSYFGVLIEKMLALGMVNVRIITHKGIAGLVEELRAARFGVTCVEGQGATGRVQIVMTVVKKKQLPDVVALIETNHPDAFYAIEEVQSASEGTFPAAKRPRILPASLANLMRSLMGKKKPELAAQRHGKANECARQSHEPEPAALR